MREIIFDTETTGLDSKADRIIEIGGVELVNHFPTGRTFHVYVNPDGTRVHPDALAVHGLSDALLSDKPVFAAIVDDLRSFFDGATWIAHNASFDMGFINAEFARLGLPPVPQDQVIDTLQLARRKNPMGPNSLDALCRRYGIDNSHRTKHGALLDSELLAEVYIEMIGGRQTALVLGKSEEVRVEVEEEEGTVAFQLSVRPRPLPPRLSSEEMAAHEAMVARLGGKAIWNKYADN
nr:DNA polymerase III subunit epsilon [uncultured Gellertiella sp.]